LIKEGHQHYSVDILPRLPKFGLVLSRDLQPLVNENVPTLMTVLRSPQSESRLASKLAEGAKNVVPVNGFE
jgi:hypothetical protein